MFAHPGLKESGIRVVRAKKSIKKLRLVRQGLAHINLRMNDIFALIASHLSDAFLAY